MKTILKDDGYVYATYQSLEESETRWEFEVYIVTAWDMKQNPIEYEDLFRGFIKWDGCSHVWVGDQDGYLHLCGGSEWFKIIECLEQIWKMAPSIIKNFDKDCAGWEKL